MEPTGPAGRSFRHPPSVTSDWAAVFYDVHTPSGPFDATQCAVETSSTCLPQSFAAQASGCSVSSAVRRPFRNASVSRISSGIGPGLDFDSSSGEKGWVNVWLCVHADSDAIQQVTFYCTYRTPHGPQIGCESPCFACKHGPVKELCPGPGGRCRVYVLLLNCVCFVVNTVLPSWFYVTLYVFQSSFNCYLISSSK